jgi:hypothetical protein
VSDHLATPPEPADLPDRISRDIAAMADVLAAGAVVDGETQVSESIWVIYGHTSYDGTIALGEYTDSVEVSAVLRAVRPRDFGGGGGLA